MDAQVTWNLWRRILREDDLQRALFAPGLAQRAEEFGLSREELSIALAYARTPRETRWAIDTYRFRSYNVVVEALYVAAPLSARLLERRGFVLDELAQEYLASVGWCDDGPYTYRLCAAALAFVNAKYGAERDPDLGALIEFEAATVALMRSLAGSELAPPPELQAEELERRQVRFVQTGRGVLVRSRFDLTPWLRDPDSIGATRLEPKPITFLRYLRSSREEPGLFALRERAQQGYELLASPRSLAELAELLGETDSAALSALLRRFAGLGVVGRAEEL